MHAADLGDQAGGRVAQAEAGRDGHRQRGHGGPRALTGERAPGDGDGDRGEAEAEALQPPAGDQPAEAERQRGQHAAERDHPEDDQDDGPPVRTVPEPADDGRGDGADQQRDVSAHWACGSEAPVDDAIAGTSGAPRLLMTATTVPMKIRTGTSAREDGAGVTRVQDPSRAEASRAVGWIAAPGGRSVPGREAGARCTSSRSRRAWWTPSPSGPGTARGRVVRLRVGRLAGRRAGRDAVLLRAGDGRDAARGRGAGDRAAGGPRPLPDLRRGVRAAPTSSCCAPAAAPTSRCSPGASSPVASVVLADVHGDGLRRWPTMCGTCGCGESDVRVGGARRGRARDGTRTRTRTSRRAGVVEIETALLAKNDHLAGAQPRAGSPSGASSRST